MSGRTVSIRSTIFPERGIHVGAGFVLALAASLLVAPWEVAAAVLLAAALHEGGHLAALAAFGVPVDGLRLGACGAVIYAPGARRLSYGRELAVTLAGPLVNLALAPLLARLAVRYGWAWLCLFAGAHLVLGVYNLLPIPPLDGARALYLLAAYRCGPVLGERICAAAGLCCASALALLGARVFVTGRGALLLLSALYLLCGALRGGGRSTYSKII